MKEISKWLDQMSEVCCIPKKNFVHFGRWFVNGRGDLVAYVFETPISAYTIYYDGLTRGKDSYQEAEDEWVSCLRDKEWMEEEIDFTAFRQAFNLAWSRSELTNKNDEDFIKQREILDAYEYGQGTPCAADYVSPQIDFQSEDQFINYGDSSCGVMILLEFSEGQQMFHFNTFNPQGIPYQGGSNYYATIAETTIRIASPFTKVMRARMHNGAIFTLDQVIAEWNYYVFLMLQFNEDVEAYGAFEKPRKEDIRRIEQRTNYQVGDYEENELMKLRTIGLPTIRQ